MKKLIIALAASSAIAGAAYAQQGSPTAPDIEQDSTTLPAEQTQPTGASDAPAVDPAEDPTAPDQEQDETEEDPDELLRRQSATDAAPVGEEEPTDPDQEQDATVQ